MTKLFNRAAPILLTASIALLVASTSADRANAQVLGSPGDTVEVTWAGKPTKGKVDTCTSTSCYLFLYDDELERWSDGTAYFPKKEIRGLKGPARAEPATPEAAGPEAARPQTPQADAAPEAAIPPVPQRSYEVGQRVQYVEGGRWFEAVITQVATDEEVANFGPYHAYRVHALGYGDDAWVGGFTDNRAQLRPAGTGPTEPVPGGAANDPVLRSLQAATPGEAAPPQAAGAGIPPGHYGCSFDGGGSPGYVDIRGATYRGPSLTGSGAFSAYSMAGSDITWTGGFGEFNVASSQFMGGDTSGRPWFAVTYNRTHGGGVDRLDCLRE